MADQILDDIKNRIDIVDLVGSSVQLKRAGTNFKGLCPFHNEKSGSFMVSPSKQIWHCFGCGLGGDIFEFTKRIENIEFRDALKILANRAGVELPEYKKGDAERDQKKDTLKRINAFTAQYYHKLLLSVRGKTALEYLLKRGLTKATIEQWEIGCASEDFHALEPILVTKGVTLADMLAAGVSVKSSKGNVFDRFRDRITFPIRNYLGDIVGFSARVLKDADNQAKYINSPDTDIYHKGKTLFGLYEAKASIRKLDYTIVVEGQMDCIKTHQAGFTNTVATSGTALTTDQLLLLKRLSKNVIFCFDNDLAGQAAMKRASMLALPLGFAVKVMELGKAKDPDELLSRDPKAFATKLKAATWLLDALILEAQHGFIPGSIEEKKYVTKEVLPFVQILVDPVEQEHYLKKIAQTFTISEKMLGGIKATAPVADTPASEAPTVSAISLQEKEIFGALLSLPDFTKRVIADLDPEDFEIPEVRKYVETLVLGGEPDPVITQSVLAQEAVFMVESQMSNGQQTKDAAQGELYRSFYLLRVKKIKNKITRQIAELKRAESRHDKALTTKLTLEYTDSQALRKKFESYL